MSWSWHHLYLCIHSGKLALPWKIHAFDVIYQEKFGFSMAMLVYWRVYKRSKPTIFHVHRCPTSVPLCLTDTVISRRCLLSPDFAVASFLMYWGKEGGAISGVTYHPSYTRPPIIMVQWKIGVSPIVDTFQIQPFFHWTMIMGERVFCIYIYIYLYIRSCPNPVTVGK